jgi:hypothetical protein
MVREHPAMSPLCTASAQRSIRFRICRSSSVLTHSTRRRHWFGRFNEVDFEKRRNSPRRVSAP